VDERQQVIRQSDVNLADLRAEAARSLNAQLIGELTALAKKADGILAAERALSDALAEALRECYGELAPYNPSARKAVAALARYSAARE
jgi:hypothetical protein